MSDRPTAPSCACRTEADRAALPTACLPAIDDLRRFIDRRIAELSAEVHGAVQMVDLSESNLSGQLERLRAGLAGLIAAPSLATRNSGLELEAVVAATEAAADRIMSAAEAIAERLRDNAADPEAVRAIAGDVEVIFEACAFQDLTSQRIRRAIDHLRQVDDILTGLVRGIPAALPDPRPAAAGAAASAEPADLAQSDIDRLLAVG